MNKNEKLLASISLAMLLASPVFVMAAPPLSAANPPGLPNTTSQLWPTVVALLAFIWPIFIGFAILMFLLAGFLFLTAQGDPTKVKEARYAIIWGVVGVIVGIFSFSLPFIIGSNIFASF